MRFGIDRLVADPALRAPLAGRRVALLAHPASLTADLTHSLDALAACPEIDALRRLRPAAWPAGRQAGQHGREPGFPRSGARHPGVLPLRRGAPPHRRDAGDVRRPPLRPAGPRLPHLHLHHHAAVRAGGGRAARQGGLGARPSQPRRPPHRGPGASPRLGELRRRRADADAPRPDARRARPLVRRHAEARCRLPGHRDGGLAPRTPHPATAGRSANGPGSTPAPTPPTSGWPAPMPAR